MGQFYPCYQENYSIIDFKESKCDLNTMDYISQSPIHYSKGNCECVLKCTKFPEKKANGYMLKTNLSSIKHRYNKLGDGFNKKTGKNNYTCTMIDK